MQTRSRAWISITSLALVAGAGIATMSAIPAATPAPAPAAADTYTVDKVHSGVVFKIRHMGVANVYGMIHEPTGSFTIDPANPGASAIEVIVPSGKVDTGNAGRDAHIRKVDFFNAGEFPTITFKSTKFTPVSEGVYDVTGDLTFIGKTNPVTARLTVLGQGQGRGKQIMGVEATFSIKRTDFGNSTNVKDGGLSDEVWLTVALEGAK
ncbi:MAG: YceI family protein [Planctomycetota bacterium]|nr:YceI family protein [Planctomycetota bacterium]